VTRRARLTEASFGLGLDPRHRAARLAAILYALGALTLLASDAFLPPTVNATAILAVALLALASTVPVVLLPWRRFPSWSTVLPLVWGIGLITTVGAWAGGLAHFVLFYGLASLYVGLTQPRGSWRWVAPLNVASVAVALLGNEPATSTVDLVGAASLCVVIGEVLAGAVQRTIEASRSSSTLLDAVTSLQGLSTERDAADALAGLAQTLLTPDSSLVMVASQPGSPLYVNRGQRGVAAPLGSLVVDASGRSGIGLALTEGRAIFVSEAHRSPLLAQAVIAKLGLQSVLFIPIPGEGGYLGCLVLGWTAPKQALDPFSEQVVSLLSDQAGTLLERLRDVGVLRQQARTDALTGLANRRAFLDALDRLRPGGAVVFLDLDHFKKLNDTAGHQAGDEVLTAFAKALRASVRDGDCAARYGGEEFALVLPSAASVDMSEAAEVVVHRLREKWDGPVTFSVGIAVHRLGDAPSTTLARADAAVYEAKANGRNTLVVA
jgi:diguanylate cyclase (GGDEF)-like protein